jgi:hypothetical protein
MTALSTRAQLPMALTDSRLRRSARALRRERLSKPLRDLELQEGICGGTTRTSVVKQNTPLRSPYWNPTRTMADSCGIPSREVGACRKDEMFGKEHWR